MQAYGSLLDIDAARRLFAPLLRATNEVVACAYLDPKWRLLGLRHAAGRSGRVRPSIRMIVQDALAFDSAAMILAHNHPSGDPTPSVEDIAFTRECASTLHGIGIRLVDHLILASGGWRSFRLLGLL